MKCFQNKNIKFILITIAGFLLGSCSEEKVPEISVRKIINLPSPLIESSGAVFYKGLLWSFNDSGGEPKLFGVDTNTSTIKHVIEIGNANNFDWEAIYIDSTFFYLADIGNNVTSRNNFQIYKFRRDSIQFKDYQKIDNTELIEFSIPDKVLDNLGISYTIFDTEAIIAENDSIYIYSKDRVNLSSSVISIPNKKGKYIANFVGSFKNLNGVITEAAKYKNKIALLGYNNEMPFLVISEKPLTNNNKTTKRYNIENLLFVKTEGLMFYGDRIFVTCENFLTESALYEIYISE